MATKRMRRRKLKDPCHVHFHSIEVARWTLIAARATCLARLCLVVVQLCPLRSLWRREWQDRLWQHKTRPARPRSRPRPQYTRPRPTVSDHITGLHSSNIQWCRKCPVPERNYFSECGASISAGTCLAGRTVWRKKLKDYLFFCVMDTCSSQPIFRWLEMTNSILWHVVHAWSQSDYDYDHTRCVRFS